MSEITQPLTQRITSPLMGDYRVPLGGAAYNPVIALGADLLGYWDADSRYWGANGNMTIVTGASSWKDVVAGYDAVQATAGSQPLFSATSFNGAPSLTFDGTDDQLTLASQPFPTSAFEIWVLCQQDAAAADATVRAAVAYGGNASTTAVLLGRTVTTGTNRGRATIGDGGTGQPLPATTTDLSSRHVERLVVGASSSSLIVDGGAANNLTVTPSIGATRLRHGASTLNTPSGFWQGKVAAVLITNALSAAKATSLQAWLLSRRMLPAVVIGFLWAPVLSDLNGESVLDDLTQQTVMQLVEA